MTQVIEGLLFTFPAYIGVVVAPPAAALLWSAVALILIACPACLSPWPACRVCGLVITLPPGWHWVELMQASSADPER
ncbi:MAG: hypothetical protein J2P48_18985 [Alphaproteobacteria bacterium]|nr:hypothetical protein [Alphaproteobacteria bacterium]